MLHRFTKLRSNNFHFQSKAELLDINLDRLNQEKKDEITINVYLLRFLIILYCLCIM